MIQVHDEKATPMFGCDRVSLSRLCWDCRYMTRHAEQTHALLLFVSFLSGSVLFCFVLCLRQDISM